MDARLREVDTAANELIQARRAAISPECARIIEQVRARCPDTFVGRQLKPSELRPPVDVNPDETQSCSPPRSSTRPPTARRRPMLFCGSTAPRNFWFSPPRRNWRPQTGSPSWASRYEAGGVEIVVPSALGAGHLPTCGCRIARPWGSGGFFVLVDESVASLSGGHRPVGIAGLRSAGDEQAPGCLRGPRAGRVHRHPDKRDPPGDHVDEEQKVEPSTERRVDGNEVARSRRLRLHQRRP